MPKQHPEHQLRIDRRTSGVTVVGRQVLAQLTQIENSIDASKQVIGRNVRVEVERVKKLILRGGLLSHHRDNTSSSVGLHLRPRPATVVHRVFQRNRPVADFRFRPEADPRSVSG
jgi:hypothetical protein